MSGVCGDMLIMFPELLKTYEVFKMEPRIGGGYGARHDKRKVQGYWSWRKQTKTGIEGDLNVPDHQATFWARQYFGKGKVVVGQNDFVEVDGVLFRIINDQNFTLEGGFYKCLMQKLAGPTDQQVTNVSVDEAIRSDY